MSRVFVTQAPSVRIPGGWKPKFDMSAAERFGEMLVMMPEGNAEPDTAQECIGEMMNFMAKHDFSSDDYLLMLGDPVLIALASSGATQTLDPGESLKLLRWDARAKDYVAFSVRL